MATVRTLGTGPSFRPLIGLVVNASMAISPAAPAPLATRSDGAVHVDRGCGARAKGRGAARRRGRQRRGRELLFGLQLEIDLLGLRARPDQSQDEPLERTVQHIRQHRGEEELAWQEDEADDRGNKDDAGHDLTWRAPADRGHRWVRDVAHHEHGQKSHQPGQYRMPRKLRERLVVGEENDRLIVERRLAEPVIGRQGQARRGAGETVEVRFRSPGLLDVESREAEHGARRKQEDEQPFPVLGVEHREVHDHRGCEPEGDRVHERVELLAHTAARAGGAGDTSVERVGDAPEKDKQSRLPERESRGKHDRENPAKQVEKREPVRQIDDRTPNRRTPDARRHWEASSPITLTPAYVTSPTRTRMWAVAGRKMSTRDPKRMMPMRSPWVTCAPSTL